MKNSVTRLTLLALCAWPITSMARVWVGADVGLTGGALAGTSPAGVYGGISTRSFPVGIELGYQALSANPTKVGIFSVTGLYRTRIPRVRGLHFLARAGVAHIYSSNGAFVVNSTRPIIGAGVSYRVSRPLSLRAEYDLILNARTAYGPSQNGDELMVGATYHFAVR